MEENHVTCVKCLKNLLNAYKNSFHKQETIFTCGRVNILDIFATNRPGLIQKVEVIPGLSDHEVIKIVFSLAITVIKSRPRTKLLWHQANLQSLKERIQHFSSKFISDYSIDTQIQDLWDIFKSQMLGPDTF